MSRELAGTGLVPFKRGRVETIQTKAAPVAFSELLRICELRTKIVSMSSVLIGSAWAATSSARFSWETFALVALGAFFVDVGCASFNSYFDFKSGVDRADTDREKMKVLVHRAIDPRYALGLGLLAFAIAAPLGLALGARVGWEVVGAGAAGMLIAVCYSGGPLPISRTAIGELFAGGVLGSLLIALTAYVQAGRVDAGAIWLGVPSTLVIASILTVNNTCDIVGDARAGRRTLSILLGEKRAARVIEAELALGYGLAFALIPLGVLPALAAAPLALAAFFAVRTVKQMNARGYSHDTKAPSMSGIAAVLATYSLAILAGLALRAILH